MEKYVLRTDEPESSPRNLWGLRPAASLEDAKEIFRNHITNWHCSSSSKSIHLRRMQEDRARRLREDDFDVELL